MHAATLAKSARLQKFVECLRTGPKTTREIIETTGLCAVNSIAAECRANGIPIGCEYVEMTEEGNRVYRYWLDWEDA